MAEDRVIDLLQPRLTRATFEQQKKHSLGTFDDQFGPLYICQIKMEGILQYCPSIFVEKTRLETEENAPRRER